MGKLVQIQNDYIDIDHIELISYNFRGLFSDYEIITSGGFKRKVQKELGEQIIKEKGCFSFGTGAINPISSSSIPPINSSVLSSGEKRRKSLLLQ